MPVCAALPFLGIALDARVGQTAQLVVTTREIRETRVTPALPRGSRLGERLRQLRVSSGLTQTDLAGERFSKEYISQLERCKTRPTRETIEWLAQKLAGDSGFLERGVSADER